MAYGPAGTIHSLSGFWLSLSLTAYFITILALLTHRFIEGGRLRIVRFALQASVPRLRGEREAFTSYARDDTARYARDDTCTA
jgi:hypothetical protein